MNILSPSQALQGLSGILPASSGILSHIDSIVSHHAQTIALERDDVPQAEGQHG